MLTQREILIISLVNYVATKRESVTLIIDKLYLTVEAIDDYLVWRIMGGNTFITSNTDDERDYAIDKLLSKH